MPRRPDDGTLTTRQVAELSRVSYRQLDYWVGAGLLSIADRSPGSGSVRRWTPDEVGRARAFAELVHAGVEPSAIAEALPTLGLGLSGTTFVIRLGTLFVAGELS